MKIAELIPELTFVHSYDGCETYILDKKGFKPMILGINKRDKRYFLNQSSFFYTEESEITKAVYDFQNEHIEKGYKEDALIFRNLKNSNYKTLIEKMVKSLDEKKELFCEKVKYEGKADKTLEEKLGSEEYKKFIEHCEELCNKPLLPSDIFNFPNTKPTYEDLEKSLEKHKDILWKQFGISLMYDDKYYQRNEYKPKSIYPNLERCDWTWRPENEPFYVSNYCHSDIDNSKVEMYDAEPFVKYFYSTDSYIKDIKDENESLGSSYICKKASEAVQGKIIATLTPVKEGCTKEIWIDEERNQTIITYYENGITHVSTPSKNYFLFKLSK